MPEPLVNYLAEFKDVSVGENRASKEENDIGSTELLNNQRLTAAVQAARAEGVVEGLATARAEHEAAILREKSAFHTHLAAEREKWLLEESHRLGICFKEALNAIETSLARELSTALTPFINICLRHEVINHISESIRTLLGAKIYNSIEISGPIDLLSVVRKELSNHSVAVKCFESDSVDVRVVADQTAMESGCSAWLERIKSLMS